MARSTLATQANALVTKFISIYEDRYKTKPQINRYREKYGFQDMITDLGYERAGQIVEYYFSTGAPGHTVNHLLYNYDKINQAYNEQALDSENRARLRKQTEKLVKEWEERRGTNGIEGNISTDEE